MVDAPARRADAPAPIPPPTRRRAGRIVGVPDPSGVDAPRASNAASDGAGPEGGLLHDRADRVSPRVPAPPRPAGPGVPAPEESSSLSPRPQRIHRHVPPGVPIVPRPSSPPS